MVHGEEQWQLHRGKGGGGREERGEGDHSDEILVLGNGKGAVFGQPHQKHLFALLGTGDVHRQVGVLRDEENRTARKQ